MIRRSHFEDDFETNLRDRGIGVVYEPIKLQYVLHKTYTPDWRLDNGIYIETKGLLDSETRRKMLAVKEQNPDVEIRFAFMNASRPIYRGSKTTYGDWATKNGFKWCERVIPDDWAKAHRVRKHSQ